MVIIDGGRLLPGRCARPYVEDQNTFVVRVFRRTLLWISRQNNFLLIVRMVGLSVYSLSWPCEEPGRGQGDSYRRPRRDLRPDGDKQRHRFSRIVPGNQPISVPNGDPRNERLCGCLDLLLFSFDKTEREEQLVLPLLRWLSSFLKTVLLLKSCGCGELHPRDPLT